MDTRKGSRSGFTSAAPREIAEPLVEAFCAALRRACARVESASFGARMEASFVNDGPVTILLDA